MKCEQVQAALPDFVLGLADEETAQAIRAHLRQCPACAGEYGAYLESVHSLAMLAPPATPRPEIKEQILARLPTSARPRGGWLQRLALGWRARQGWAMGVAVLLLMFVAAATLFTALTGRYGQALRLVRMKGTEHAPAAQGLLVFVPHQTHALLIVSGLPPTPPDRAYQLWLIRPDGQRVSGAVFAPTKARTWHLVPVTAPNALDAFPGFGITIEPRGGSPRPTGPKVMGSRGEF